MKRPKLMSDLGMAAEAAGTLSAFGKSFEPPRSDLSPADIARDSTQDPRIRQLLRGKLGTVEAYDRWTRENVPKMAKNARYVINQEQYDRLVRRTGEDLLKTWRELSSDGVAQVAYGIAFRCVDLLFMSINESERCRFAPIQDFLHVPLDGSTLNPIRRCLDELLARDFSIEVPAVVPKGFVSTPELYVLLQEAIFALSARARIPPILYAYYCAEL